jgi:hypothetical protein
MSLIPNSSIGPSSPPSSGAGCKHLLLACIKKKSLIIMKLEKESMINSKAEMYLWSRYGQDLVEPFFLSYLFINYLFYIVAKLIIYIISFLYFLLVILIILRNFIYIVTINIRLPFHKIFYFFLPEFEVPMPSKQSFLLHIFRFDRR